MARTRQNPYQSTQPAAIFFNHIESGCVWSGDAYASTRAASMTSGVVWINGVRLTVAAVTSRTFTASKDTYADFADNGNGTAKIIYTEVNNNAASPTTLSDSSTFSDTANIRSGIIVTGASNIASAGSVNQGQEDKVLPIASSTPYAVTDSLGNLICPRDPSRKVLGYRQITSVFTLSSSQTTATQVTGLSCPVIVPTGRKVRVTYYAYDVSAATSGDIAVPSIWDGTVNSGTRIQEQNSNAATVALLHSSVVVTPSSTSKTYNAGIRNGTASRNLAVDAGPGRPAYIMVELY